MMPALTVLTELATVWKMLTSRIEPLPHDAAQDAEAEHRTATVAAHDREADLHTREDDPHVEDRTDEDAAEDAGERQLTVSRGRLHGRA